MAGLHINDDDDEVLHVAEVSEGQNRMYDLCLMGCFLIASVVQFQAMRNTLPNLWHLLGGIEILDMGKKRFLFWFFHRVDIEKVVKGAHWTFNNHLLEFIV
ncbi:hypothetical protein J1N35_018172 [Gossypium stocksii]|uniref:DUF4283 domain-containing protein n=1 Tax=Gossypium stocksii TaxID=47602 RepID=A0A9D3VQ79_9ROSI|nr:hypothetical protein J1N35_018172 [Gossypium stocksii]